MPSIDSKTKILSLVDPTVANLSEKLIKELRGRNVIAVPYMGLRTVDHQNTLYCQSRDAATIEAEAARLKQKGCPYLADQLIKSQNVARGKKVTRVVGGLSWHNWGLAVDFYIATPGGMPIWDGQDPQYQILGEVAKSLGFRWGGDFRSLPDWGHIQLPQGEVHEEHTYPEIDRHFKQLGR